jgi:hypothetical protein
MAASISWSDAFRDAAWSGGAASLASAIVLSLRGRRDLRDAAAPLNGPSQWVWGKQAPYRDGFSVRHTVVGYAIHHLAATFWALFYEKARPEERHPAALAIATSAIAGLVDFKLTPERLTPGFEKRLSRRSLVWVYAAFALGLAAPSLLRKPGS